MAARAAAAAMGSSSSSVDLTAAAATSASSSPPAALECGEECARLERDRRLALALQVENPNDRIRAPKYSDFLKDYCKKEPAFARAVHVKLADLVKLAKDVRLLIII